MVFSKLAAGLVNGVQRFFTSPTTLKVVTQSLAQVMLDQPHANPLLTEGLSSLTPLSHLPTLCPVCFTQWLIVRLGGDGEVDKPCCNCGNLFNNQMGDSRGFGDQRGRLCGKECLSRFEVEGFAKAKAAGNAIPWVRDVPVSYEKDGSPPGRGFRSWQPIGSNLVPQTLTCHSMVNMPTCRLLPHTPPTPDYDTCPLMAEDWRIPQPRVRDFQWTWINNHDVKNTRFIGKGSYGQVSNCRYEGQRAILKTFNERNEFLGVLYEADVGAMMSVLGVGPPVMGMVRPDVTTCNMPAIMWKQLPKTLTFATVIQRVNSFQLTDILNMLCQIARLLRVMHSHKVIHNDIKPNNIIVTANPLFTYDAALGPPAPGGSLGSLNETHRYRVYIIDFGNATYDEGFQYQLTEEEKGKYLKVSYLSPEACNGDSTTDKSDVFSLGHLFSLTGEHCFDPQLYFEIDLLSRDCRREDPASRPTMAEVERRLTASEKKFLEKLRKTGSNSL